MRTAAAYVRVSDERQEEFSPDSQIKRLREYAEKNGMYIPDELIFRDDGISGKKAEKRPGFNEMIAIAKQKEKPFDAILVWKFSRFARNQEESIVYKSLLRKNGVEVISISETLDNNPFSGLIERIIEWMDEYYLIRLSDEVRRGMTERATRGLPNTAPPYGYTMKKGGNYEIAEEEAEVVRTIFQMYLDGHGFKPIVSYLRERDVRNHWGNHIDNRGVEYILNNSAYAGLLRWNPHGRSASARNYNNSQDIVRKGSYTPIIDADTFNKVKERLAEQKKLTRRYERKAEVQEEFMLRGIVKCNTCNHTLTYNRANRGLQCHHYSRGLCPISHFINLDTLDMLVIEELKRHVRDRDFDVVNTPSASKAESIDFEAKINSQIMKIDRAKQAYQAGVDSLDEYRAEKAKIEREISRLKEQQQKAALNTAGTNAEEFAEVINNALLILENPEISGELKNKTIKTFVDKIIFYKPERKIKIYFKV